MQFLVDFFHFFPFIKVRSFVGKKLGIPHYLACVNLENAKLKILAILKTD